jgi:hypothetical protein
MAENAVADIFNETGTIMRPGFIFGVRKVCTMM